MIWCVEDDAGIRDIEIYTLNSMGLQAIGFENGTDLFDALQNDKPELILLDIMLPDMDGVEILKRLKVSPSTSEIPVIMATAKGQEYDKVQSFDIGADDYLTKPFGMMEMVSRVKAVLRRCSHDKSKNVLKNGDLILNPDEHIVTAEGKKVVLTYKEFELLKLFMSNIGIAYDRDKLMKVIWQTEFGGETRTVDVHIRTLRNKLGKCGDLIETVRGIGYRMEASHD